MGRGRQGELDGLRALAVAGVVLWHAGWVNGPAGAVGVTVFFVLSGYLITRLLTAGPVDLRQFWTRRVARLAPALVVMVTLTWAWRTALGHHEGGAALAALLYVENIRQGHLGIAEGPYTHTWSLALEEQFYLLWPLAVAAIAGRRRLLTVAVAVTVASLAARTMWTSVDGAYSSPLTSCYLIAAGCCIALHPVRVPRWTGRAALSGIAVLALVPIGTQDRDVLTVQTLAAALTCAVVLKPPRSMAWAPLVWIGERSYGIYLWHVPLFMSPLVPGLGGQWRTTASIAFTLLAATASYRWVEQPIRDRVRSRRLTEPVDPQLALAT